MATFAPELQPVDQPNYIKLAGEPITQPTPDKSKGLSLATAGTAIEDATTIAERAQQQNISEKTRAGVDALRDTTSLQYEMIRNAQMTGQPLPQEALKAAGLSSSLLGQVGSDVPPGLQAGIDKASSIGMALAQGGSSRANDTLYTGALNSLAKQLRAEYPGHKDFVDEQISKISGKNPANAYMDNLLADINRNAVATNAGRNRLLTDAYQVMNEVGGPDLQHSLWPYIKAYENNLPGSEENLARVINQTRFQDYKYKEWQRQREINNANKTDQAFDAKGQYQQELAASGNRLFNQIVDIPGLSSPETISQLVTDSQEGRITLTADQHRMLYAAAKSAEDRFYRQGKDMAVTRGYSTAIRDPAAEKAILDNEATNFHRLVEAIGNKDYGTLFEAQRHIKAVQDDTKAALYDDKDMGGFWKTNQAITDIGGQVWANFLNSEGLKKQYLGNLQSFVNHQTAMASAPDDLRQDGKVKSMYSSLSQLQDAQRQGLSDPKVIARAYKDVVHVVDGITDPKSNPAVKKEIVKYAYGENNLKILDTSKMDFTDSQGKYHEGKYAVNDTLFNPGITKTIRSLNDPASWNAYKNSAETSFGMLFREDIANLGAQRSTVPVRWLWNSSTNQLDYDDGKGGRVKPSDPLDAAYVKNLEVIKNRLNGGLANLGTIHKAEGGGDTATSGYLLHTMMQLGFDPEKVGGIPSDIYNAVKNSKAKQDLSTAFEKASKAGQ